MILDGNEMRRIATAIVGNVGMDVSSYEVEMWTRAIVDTLERLSFASKEMLKISLDSMNDDK